MSIISIKSKVYGVQSFNYLLKVAYGAYSLKQINIGGVQLIAVNDRFCVDTQSGDIYTYKRVGDIYHLSSHHIYSNSRPFVSQGNKRYNYTRIQLVDREQGDREQFMLGDHILINLACNSDALASFVDKHGELPVTNHKNCLTWDNRPENLEWVQMIDNSIHGFVAGLLIDYGKRHLDSDGNPTTFDIVPLVDNSGKSFVSYKLKYMVQISDIKYFQTKHDFKFSKSTPDSLIKSFIEYLSTK